MPLSREEDFKEIMHFNYLTYMGTPSTRTTAPGVMNNTIVVDPSLVIINIHLAWLNKISE